MPDKERKIEEIPDRYKPQKIGEITSRREANIFPSAEDPTAPNRAWTEMKLGKDIDMMTEEEKRDLYIGRDNFI